eukprot:scaffold105433_cov31-Tisochrysis_lutea.AAC.10
MHRWQSRRVHRWEWNDGSSCCRSLCKIKRTAGRMYGPNRISGRGARERRTRLGLDCAAHDRVARVSWLVRKCPLFPESLPRERPCDSSHLLTDVRPTIRISIELLECSRCIERKE